MWLKVFRPCPYECWIPDVWTVGSAGGMPDLLLWNAERWEAKLSEVKGPRDRLSEQQRAWAGALAAGGLHIEVSPAPHALYANAASLRDTLAILWSESCQLDGMWFTCECT